MLSPSQRTQVPVDCELLFHLMLHPSQGTERRTVSARWKQLPSPLVQRRQAASDCTWRTEKPARAHLNEEISSIGQLSLAGLQPREPPDISGVAQRLCTKFPRVPETRTTPGGTRRGKHDNIPVTICDLGKQAFPNCRIQQKLHLA